MTTIVVGSNVIRIDGSDKAVSDEFRDRIAIPLADSLLPKAVSAKGNQLIETVVHEALKNTEHGDFGIAEIDCFPDGTAEITTVDHIGQDKLNPAFCGHLGIKLIDAIVGATNHREFLSEGEYHSWIRLDPSVIMAAV